MGKRPKMLASVVREVIAPLVRECPPECGVVSITEVDMTPDMQLATVYVSALQEVETAVAFLEEQQSEVRRRVSSLYRARVPEIRFRADLRGEHGSRIDELLQE